MTTATQDPQSPDNVVEVTIYWYHPADFFPGRWTEHATGQWALRAGATPAVSDDRFPATLSDRFAFARDQQATDANLLAAVAQTSWYGVPVRVVEIDRSGIERHPQPAAEARS